MDPDRIGTVCFAAVYRLLQGAAQFGSSHWLEQEGYMIGVVDLGAVFGMAGHIDHLRGQFESVLIVLIVLIVLFVLRSSAEEPCHRFDAVLMVCTVAGFAVAGFVGIGFVVVGYAGAAGIGVDCGITEYDVHEHDIEGVVLFPQREKRLLEIGNGVEPADLDIVAVVSGRTDAINGVRQRVALRWHVVNYSNAIHVIPLCRTIVGLWPVSVLGNQNHP